MLYFCALKNSVYNDEKIRGSIIYYPTATTETIDLGELPEPIKTFEGDSILFTDELKGTFSFTDTKLTVKFTSNNGKTGNDDLEIKYMLDYFSISDNDYTLDNAVLTIQRVYDESPVEYVLHKKL